MVNYFEVTKRDVMQKRCFRTVFFTFLIITLTICLTLFVGAASPDLLVTEQVLKDYNSSGSITSSTNQGYVKVFVPNTADVLQYVRLNFDSVANTNIGTHTDTDNQTWNMYRGAVINGTRLFREGDFDTYNISEPVGLSIGVSFSNYAGGDDLYNNDNVVDRNLDALNASYNKFLFTFTITNLGSTNFTTGTVKICFNTDTLPSNDLFNITSAGATVSPTSLSITDSDGPDGTNECAQWTGSIGPSMSNTISINATSLSGFNFGDAGPTSYDLNGAADGAYGIMAQGSANGTGLGSNLLSGMSITTKFSRGSVRQGVDMALENQPSGGTNTWQIRGFFKNPSTSLDYIVDEWRLYEVNPLTGTPMAGANLTGTGWGAVLPGITKYTGWFDTNGTGKPYYSSYFDWQINWTGLEYYNILVKSRRDLGDIYTVDFSQSKILSGVLLPNTGVELGYDYQRIGVRDIFVYLGDTNAPGEGFDIYSIYPYQGTYYNGSATGFINMDINCSSVKVYANGTDITGLTTIICVNSTDGADGFVHASIASLPSFLQPNEILNLTYSVLANESMYVGIQFNFTGNATFTTDSGTPITEIQPVVSGTTDITVSDKRLVGYKELWIPDPLNPTLVNASIRVDVYDQSDAQDGIAGIKVVDYVVNGTNFNISNVVVRLNGGILVNGINLTITDLGIITLSDGTTQVHAYEYSANATPNTFWNGTMYNGDYLTIDYQFNITSEGIYSLPAQIFGLDPATGREIATSALGVIKVDLPETAVAFEITDEQLKLVTPVTVGNPGTWTKTFTVFNPNKRPIRATFNTAIFKDAIQFYATYYDQFGNKVDEVVDKDAEKAMWQTTMNAFETRTYEIRAVTPPILETDRQVEVLEKLEDKKVKLKINIYLKSFTLEDYTGIKMRMPIAYEKIIEIKDAFGNALAYNGGADSITIDVPDMTAESVKTLTIIYKESYPAIVVTTDNDRYKTNTPVGMSILVINGGETLTHSYLETEVYDSNLDTLETSMIDLGLLEPLAKTETTQTFMIPMSAPTGMYVANVRFREDFATISQGVANFYVMGNRMANLRTIEIFLIVILGMLLIGLTYRRAREVRKKEVIAKEPEEKEEE